MPKKIITLLFIAATILWAGFIISNSLEDAEESGGKSSKVKQVIETVKENLGFEGEVSEKKIRKGAHFSEFFLLSVLLCTDFYLIIIHGRSQTARGKAGILACSLILSLTVAVADELTQYLSPGRYPSPVDVLIDFSGALVAYVVFLSALLLMTFIKVKKSGNPEASA